MHFEDLDAHRFEDLVRELIYEFRDWQSIEATGRSGSDEGFDIRAFEKVSVQPPPMDEEESEEAPVAHPMEGNQWMIQCKREKEIGPTKVAEIIDDGVDKKNPPYGYILVAPVNFSKKSYDSFRAKLRTLGVMEFYLWGKAELEDMLHMPKNDRLLFTYFGISLVTRTRSRAAEIHFTVTNKNKVYRVVSEHITGTFRTQVLVRDIKDTKYPYKGEYSDFDKNPRWKEYSAFAYHPLGLWVHSREYYAYVDPVKKVWDYTSAVDLVYRKRDEDDREKVLELRRRVEDFWDHLPRRNKAKLIVDGLIKFDDMIAIDAKGDSLFEGPQLFVDLKPKLGPFCGFQDYIRTEEGQHFDLSESKYKKIKKFPKEFPDPKIGTIYKDKAVEFDSATLSMFKHASDQLHEFYDCDGKYDFLKQRDVIHVAETDEGDGPQFIQITHKFTSKAAEYLKDNGETDYRKRAIERQIGRTLVPENCVTVFEFKRVYRYQFEKRQPT